MVKMFHPHGLKELVWKAGRSTERTTFTRMLKKYPGSGVRAYKVAQQKGLRKIQSLGKRLGVEGLGVGKGIKTIKKFKPSRIRPRHTRGKDFPDIADDTTIGGVKAFADMPSIKARASKEAIDVKHMWGFSGKSVSELAPELHAGKKSFGRIYSKPGSKAYKRLIKKKK
tara:strand:+ start:52 stop:558 length:507 start_codon:yes stop_codon:yes gene_type:complete